MNIESSKTRFEEIILPSTESHMLLLQKCNAQIVEFNPQGTLAAIGCKYGIILILDMLSKEVVRCFNMYETQSNQKCFEANIDVDQFGIYRKVNFAYADDDFVYQQRQRPTTNPNVGESEPQPKKQEKVEAEDFNQKHYVFKIEPKDKINCKAQISNIDWSVDGRMICAAFKVANTAIVWNINTCKKVYEFVSGNNNFGAINNALFYNLNPNYIQISGDKAVIVDIQKDQQVYVSENQQAVVSTKETQQAQSKNIKRKGTSNKQSTFILRSIFNGGHRYYILVDNQSKLIFLLGDKKDAGSKSKYEVSQFFNISQIQLGQVPAGKFGDEEMKNEGQDFNFQSALESITPAMVEQIQTAIEQVNSDKFEILGIHKFKNSNSFVQYISFNEECTYMLCTCSDRALRLYYFDFMAIRSSKNSPQKYKSRIIYLKNEIKDVINGRKWQNSAFIKLNQNTLIVDQQNQFDYEKLESRGSGKNEGTSGAELYYGGNPVAVGSTSNTIKQNKRQELFISSMGETGANELKFFNLTGDSREHQCLQRVELTIDGCNYLSVHAKTHFTVLIASNNGSVFAWHTRPAKLIQPLAPGFHEIERNIWYVEREDEFENEVTDEKLKANLQKREDKNKHLGLIPLDERQQQLALVDIDIEKTSPGINSLANCIQNFAQKRPDLQSLDHLFKKKDKRGCEINIMSFIPVHVSSSDQYAEMAQANLNLLREKYNNLLQQ